MDMDAFRAFLNLHDEPAWDEVLADLEPSLHPVDREATRIWFGFWPLKLQRILRESTDEAATAQQYLLDGRYRLEHQLDESVDFLFGSIYWDRVKAALLERSESAPGRILESLGSEIRSLAGGVASQLKVEASLLLGISAVGFMAFQQVGEQPFRNGSASGSSRTKRPNPEKILKQRSRTTSQGLFGFLRTVNRKFTVRFDESKRDAAFSCIEGQDLSSASAGDDRDYQTRDHRCIAGPIPAECRVASCGYCWIGVLSGREKIVEVSAHERRRLNYFGYLDSSSHTESHPVIRLACQSKCYGDVTVVVPPWNGSLDGRR